LPKRITPERRDDILDAALALLGEGGLAAVTTTALARRASCSKDTLYTLFENREAILAALVQRQADALNASLQPGAGDPTQALVQAGAQLLSLLTSPESLSINRAALADSSGTLSAILIAQGRDRSAPKIVSIIEKLRANGTIVVNDMQDAYQGFYGLLVGDLQIRALHGALSPLPDALECQARSRRAVQRFVTLFASDGLPLT